MGVCPAMSWRPILGCANRLWTPPPTTQNWTSGFRRWTNIFYFPQKKHQRNIPQKSWTEPRKKKRNKILMNCHLRCHLPKWTSGRDLTSSNGTRLQKLDFQNSAQLLGSFLITAQPCRPPHPSTDPSLARRHAKPHSDVIRAQRSGPILTPGCVSAKDEALKSPKKVDTKADKNTFWNEASVLSNTSAHKRGS